MSTPADAGRRDAGRRARHVAAFLLIVLAQFGMFEAGLRLWGSSEAAPSFQGLFENDPVVGYRLKPNARVRFTTAEFDTHLRINGAGLRDDEEVGPKAANERRIVLLGDSIVLSVQVPFAETFGEQLEADLNGRGDGLRYRVLNAGVQGYGPVEEALFFQRIAPALQPDLVMVVVFVGNDAEEAFASRRKLDPAARSQTSVISESLTTRLRRLVRRSMVLQIIRLRAVTAAGRFTTFSPPEPPAQSYAASPPPRIAEGLALSRRSVEMVVEQAGKLGARSAIVLMPARFQVDEGDYGRLREIIRQSGGELVRDAATDRFEAELARVPVPRMDTLPAMRSRLPGPDLFFQTTVHLTPRGHRVVADALRDFIEDQGLLGAAAKEASH